MGGLQSPAEGRERIRASSFSSKALKRALLVRALQVVQQQESYKVQVKKLLLLRSYTH